MKRPLIVAAIVVVAYAAVRSAAAAAPAAPRRATEAFALQDRATTPLDRLKANIERITRSENATWGIYVKSLDTGEEVAIR